MRAKKNVLSFSSCLTYEYYFLDMSYVGLAETMTHRVMWEHQSTRKVLPAWSRKGDTSILKD